MRKIYIGLLTGLFTVLLIPILSADEGMWTFNNPPVAPLKDKYQFSLTESWLAHLRLAAVRFGGSSASFVSADGLVMTNHHVGSRAIQDLSTKEHDYMKNGFYAKTRAEELKCPNMDLRVLVEIEDVTLVVTDAFKSDMSGSQLAEAERAVTATLEKGCSTKTGLTCQVVKLYAGGLFHLYKYKRYTDVRLVFAPEFDIAFFGGDQDNFTYPRFDLDVSFFRVYENDAPLRSEYYLAWSKTPVKEGDLVFIAGQPGSTGRLLTYAQLEYLRDHSYPRALENYKRRQSLLHRFGQRGAEQKRIAQQSLFSIENSLKATTGYQAGLMNKNSMAKKEAEEKALRAEIVKRPDLQKEVGGAWEAIAQAQAVTRAISKPYGFLSIGSGFSTAYFSLARRLVRLADESKKPNEKRLPEYRESNLPVMMRSLLSTAPIYDEMEIVTLADSLAHMKEELGAEHEAVRLALGDRSPEVVAKELISGSTLKEVSVRQALIDGGSEAIEKSTDPMIRLAKQVDPMARAVYARHEQEVRSVETKNGALIAKAIFKLRGTSVPPDATNTLRLSYGVVKSYTENGQIIPFHTSFRGLYALSGKHGDQPPYQLPRRFVARKASVKLDTPLNFVSTTDSIGGNSGSPAVNRQGEVVGLLFDGNIQSLPNRFLYSDEVARSVMVSGSAITEALTSIYEAQPLVDELLASPPVFSRSPRPQGAE
ncbi:MAG: S46 family peptidase [Acidobacteria bacterium]|nr:S46 family peptidase [Acidobacteriota bacterium]MBI3658741.1 S46 family peptidase [Acidobacteriota bacterium]